MKRIACLLVSAAVALTSCGSAKKTDSVMKDVVFKKLAVKLSEAHSKMKKKTVAVYGFTMIGRGDDTYTKYATEKLTHELVDIGKLMVIERSRVDEVLKEQQFTMSGTVDAAMAARIGKILAVEGVIIGTISIVGNEVEYITRIIQSENAMIMASANERYSSLIFPKKAITDVAKDAIEDPAIADQTDKTDTSGGAVGLIIPRTIFVRTERITINYSGLPGNQHDWITLVKASASESTYGEWFYTNGQSKGSHTFNPVAPGKYEVRIYFDWPAGGYAVQKRVAVTVK
jgi:polyhydroxyalkanoate synthesis regulator phasin